MHGAVLPSLSMIAATMVSVESQLSCSLASLESTGASADSATWVLLLEVGSAALPAGSDGASGSEVAFVHWRAFFYKKKKNEKRTELR